MPQGNEKMQEIDDQPTENKVDDNRITEETGKAKEKDDASSSEGEGSEDEKQLKEGDKNKRLDKEGGERDLFQLVVVNSYGSQDLNILKEDGKPLRLSSTLHNCCFINVLMSCIRVCK